MKVDFGRWYPVAELYGQVNSPHPTLTRCYQKMIARYKGNVIEIRFTSKDGAEPSKDWGSLLRGALKRLIEPTGSRVYDFTSPPTRASTNDTVLFELRLGSSRPTPKAAGAPTTIEGETRKVPKLAPAEIMVPIGNKKPFFKEVLIRQFERSDAVRSYVLNLGKGYCECCNHPAPFAGDDGQPFLEVHHLKPLAEGGPDTIENTVALCPNCHRALHYAANRADKLRELCAGNSRLKFPEA